MMTDPHRVLPASDPLEAPLPADLREDLAELLDREDIPTLEAFAGALRETFGNRAVEADDLCFTDEPTPHRATVAGETYTFACFYDAVILAALRERPVSIRTESPDGTVIEATADGQGRLAVEPASAVYSFGVDPSVTAPGEGLTLERGYEAICPFVKAFPNAATYHDWRNRHAVPTVALSLSDATDLAGLLVDEA